MTKRESERIENLRKIASGEIKFVKQKPPEDPDRAFPPAPLVVFSPDALEWLTIQDRWTKSGHVMSILWSTGGGSYDPETDIYTKHGAGLVVGWYPSEWIPKDRIIDYSAFQIVFVFPETDAQEIKIKMGRADRSEASLVIDGEVPFS